MEHSVRTTLAAVVAIASACLAAPTVYADPDSSGLKEDLAPGVILGREVNTLVLPQLLAQDRGATSRRPPKPTTLLQVVALSCLLTLRSRKRS